MGWLLAAVAGLVLGIGIGVLGVRLRERSAAPAIEEPVVATTPVPEGVAEVLGVLRSSAVVLGPDDQVLQSTSQARTLGLVRGTRVPVPPVLELVHEVRQDRRIRTADLELRRSKGSPSQFLSARVAPLGHELILVLAEDRTAARRVEDTRRDFVANVSHELKTPIGAVSLLSEAIEDAADDPDAVLNFAGRMRKESERLTQLVGQIIELSRLQADDPLMRASVVPVDLVLTHSLDRNRELAKSRNIQLTLAGERGCTVMGDREQLLVAVSNLVENAIIYSDANGRVAVGAHRAEDEEDHYVEITVTDSGIGISGKDIQRIFERFYRVDYARSRANGGTGLGLSIVKHIAAAHGGQVSVWSQVGHGSTFTIRIPEHLAKEAEPDRIESYDLVQAARSQQSMGKQLESGEA